MKPKMELKSIIILLTAFTFLSFSTPVNLSTYTFSQRVEAFGNYMYSMFFTTPNLTCTTSGELSVNGSNLTITNYRLKNSGSAPSGVCFVGYYLSTDTEFTVDDYYIGQDYVEELNPGFSSIEDFSVDLSNFTNIPDGTYHVGVIIDHLNSVVEGNENDNNDCYWDSPTVVIGGKPNLSCNFGGELVVSNDTDIRITWIKVENTGVAAAGPSTVCYYLSTDQDFNSSDFLIGTSEIPALIPGEFVMVDPFEVDVATLGVPPGQYYVGFVIDCENEVMESNEEDNNDCYYDDIIIIPGDAGSPNLACLNKGELNIDENNGTLTISLSKIMSNGTVNAGASILGVYLSPDQNITTSDILLTTQNIPAIASGDMHMITPITIDYASLGLSPGAYYVGLIIDYTDLVAEIDEGDNADCSFTNTLMIPDPQQDEPNLVCDARGELIIDNNAQTLYTSWNKVLNTGSATASASVLGVYLSTDQVFTTNDLLIGAANIPALAPGQSFMVTNNINVDFGALNLAPGTYYVGLIVDHTNLIAESNEGDNVGCSWNEPRIFIPAELNEPDLTCDFRGELIIDNNAQTLYTSWNKIINNGTATAGASVLGIYLSTDQVFTTNDLLLAEENIPALAPDAFYMVTDAINIDFGALNLAPGTYYVGLIVDHTNAVAESDEANNNSCSWNEPRIFIPAELNEPNLTCGFRGELIIDNNRQTLYTSWNAIINNGSGEAAASVVGVYLSTDEVFTTNDVLLAEINIPALAAGVTHLVTNAVNVDFGTMNLPAGTYYIGLIVDHTNLVAEADESDNNSCSWNEPRVYIADDFPDDWPNLLCKDRGELTVNGTQITIEYAKVQNNGPLFSAPANVGFYVSTDQNFTTDDYFIGRTTVGQLYPSQFEMLSTFTADLADFNIPTGNYFIGFIIDYDNQIDEITETDNNTCSWATIATLPNDEPDLTCMSRGELIIDNNAQTLNVNWTKVQNIGSGTAGPSTVGFYISADQNITTSDILIATENIGSLVAGDFAMIGNNVAFDFSTLNLAPGTYYVGVIVDANNQVAESDETNNNNCSWDDPVIYITAPINDPDLACYDSGYLSVTGTSISISNLKITNIGSGAAAPNTAGIYLSTDQNFTTSDISIGSINLPTLSTGQIHTVSFNVNVAALNLPAGDYYVGVIIDDGNAVVETNESNNNNCSWETPQVHIDGDLPNLECDFGGELVITNGPHVRVTWIKVKNTGTATAPPSTVGFYLSTDQNFTPSDYFIGSVNIGALAPGETVMAPPFDADITGIPAGNYYLGFILDSEFVIIESNEGDNNDCSFDDIITINGGLPDIVCVDPGVLVVNDNGPSVVEDNSINVTVNDVIVGNEGAANSTSCKVGFYLSRDDIYGNEGDILIGSKTIPGIEVGETTTIDQFAGTIAESTVEGLEQGEYTIGILLDHEFDVEEENEENNDDCGYDDPIVIDNTPLGADLLCFDDGEIDIDGTKVNVSWVKIKNVGDVVSGGTSVSFYASLDMNFTSNDHLLGRVNIPSIQPGQMHMLNPFNVDLVNLGLPAGNYFIGFVINGTGNSVVEEEGTQGCYWDTTVHISAAQPNLTCMTRGELEPNGSVLDITWVKVQNTGGGVAGGSHLGFYLSTDLNFTTSDIYMGEVYIPSLQPGESAMAPDFQIDLSSLGLAPGTYYIGFIFDHRNVVAETNEYDNNDCYWTSPKVVVNSSKPNLTCMDDGEMTVEGTQVDVSWMKVQNNGSTAASGFFVGYYLSTDQYFTTNDYYLGNTYVGGLAAGASTTLNPFSVDIASLNIPAGTYFIGTIIDYQNNVHESNENDNNDCYWTTTATISNTQPDLACMSQGEVGINGNVVEIGWVKVINSGNAAAGASQVGVYLSTDLTFTATDILLGNIPLNALGAGQSTTLPTANFSIAGLGLSPGTYYIGYVIDNEGEVAESNEYNNNDCYFTNPTIQIPDNQAQPDLVVSCGNLSVTGSTINVNNIIVTNIGNAPASAHRVGYYLSLDTDFTTSDFYLGEDFVGALGAGQSSAEAISINLANFNIPAGTYYVGVIVDYQNEVAESNEIDNHCCFYTRIQITGNSGGGGNQKPDLRCKNRGQLSGSGNQISIVGSQVQNNGPSQAGASQVGYYLSSDANITANDYFLGSSAVGALNSGQIATVAFSGAIPSNIPAGTYYVGLIVDYANQVTERDETDNNTCSWENAVQITGNTNTGDDCACTDYYADFCEDFDSYYLGALGPQSNCWTTWSGQEGGAQDGAIRESASNRYLKVKATQASGGAQDVVLQLGNRTSGKYILNFKMYLFGGDKGYYNILHQFAPGSSNYQHAYEVYFDGNGTGRVRIGGVNQTFFYAMNAWNSISQEIDIDNNRVRLVIAGRPVATWNFTQTAGGNNGLNVLGSMNFYPVDHSYEFYIDAINFRQVASFTNEDEVENRNDAPAPIRDLATTAAVPSFDFKHYPNPTNSELFVDFELETAGDATIELINAMGQVVRTQNLSDVTIVKEVLNVADFAAGVYYVRVQAADRQLTKQVVIMK